MTEREAAAPVDDVAITAFWQRFLAATERALDTALPEAWQFGDSAELADRLLALVTDGPKRATAGSLADYENDGDEPPAIGELAVLCDGAGWPRVVIETTDVRVAPLSSVDNQFAWDEGEGDRTRADWLRIHTEAFTRRHAGIGAEMHADIPVVFERFEVRYAEPILATQKRGTHHHPRPPATDTS